MTEVIQALFEGETIMKSSLLVRVAALTVAAFTAVAAADVRIQGAGSTFVNPMMQRWVAEFQKVHPDTKIDYQSIGSGGGIKGFTEKTIDFGATDAQLNKKELEKVGGEEKIVEFPIISGGVVPAYNLPGVTGEVKFSGAVLADIYLGKITKWNDPKLAELNAGVTLPDLAITPASRTDGSGTNFIFTSYLGTQSKEFVEKVGVAKQVKWPVGVGGKGNEGVTAVVQQTPGAIGYIEQAYADQNKISYGSVQNKNGKFVKCSPASVSKAGESVAGQVKGNLLVANFWNQAGDEAYPIAGVTYIVLYKDLSNIKSKEQATQLVQFLTWAAKDGQKLASELDYAPMSDAMIEKIEAAIANLSYGGETIKTADAK